MEVLNWYPNRNPSEETNKTTGCLSFERFRAFDSTEKEADGDEAEEEEEEG